MAFSQGSSPSTGTPTGSYLHWPHADGHMAPGCYWGVYMCDHEQTRSSQASEEKAPGLGKPLWLGSQGQLLQFSHITHHISTSLGRVTPVHTSQERGKEPGASSSTSFLNEETKAQEGLGKGLRMAIQGTGGRNTV